VWVHVVDVAFVPRRDVWSCHATVVVYVVVVVVVVIIVFNGKLGCQAKLCGSTIVVVVGRHHARVIDIL
jgi:hypothetical protein